METSEAADWPLSEDFSSILVTNCWCIKTDIHYTEITVFSSSVNRVI